MLFPDSQSPFRKNMHRKKINFVTADVRSGTETEVKLENTMDRILFEYGTREVGHLRRKDRRLGELIDRVGPLERQTNPDLFASLTSCIIGQQISNRAAETVCAKFAALLGDITPERVAQTNHFDIKACGMSLKKAGYIKVAADAVLSGTLDMAAFPAMSDAQLIEQLTALPGIGVWTAEMLMIFSLRRPDVLSYDDLIIRRSLMSLYGLKELTREQFEKYRKRYSPYGSVASLYLWAMADETAVNDK